jgi:hypothetical protein
MPPEALEQANREAFSPVFMGSMNGGRDMPPTQSPRSIRLSRPVQPSSSLSGPDGE